MPESVAIVGAGPAGCALACFLVERGINCVVFDDDKKPSLLVGESLVPAAIPIIQRLGIEKEVAKCSQRKEGAALRSNNTRVNFEFTKLGNNIPAYAYNIPRPKFDSIVRQRAETLGVKFVTHRAQLIATPNDSERDIQLSDESLHAAGLDRASQPDVLIDATGRTRLFSKTLNIPATRGPRSDIAHFAHFKNFPSDSAQTGQIVISVLKCGWSWQIPFSDRTSVGVVMNSKTAKKYGNNPEQRLQNIFHDNPFLNKLGSIRISDVQTYSNYQLLSQQANGRGWILLGDALGFVDPMLSPGVFMALESASLLDKHYFAQAQSKRQNGLQQYFSDIKHWHQSWSTLIEYFYNGQILNLAERRPHFTEDSPRYSFARLADNLVGKMLSQLVSGAGTRSKLYQSALYRTCQLLSPSQEKLVEYAIHDFVEEPIEIKILNQAETINETNTVNKLTAQG